MRFVAQPAIERRQRLLEVRDSALYQHGVSRRVLKSPARGFPRGARSALAPYSGEAPLSELATEQPEDLAPRVATLLRARILSTLVDTAMAIALVRLLPKAEFAVLGVAFVVYELAKQLSVGGFADSLLVLVPVAAEGSRRPLAFRTARLLLITGTVAAVVTLGMAASVSLWLSHWQAADRALEANVLCAFAAVCVLEFPSLPLTQLLLSLDHQRAAGRWEVVTSVASLIALLGPVILGYGVMVSAVCLAVWAGCRTLIALTVARSVLPKASEALPRGSLREQLDFALPLGVHTLVNRLNKHADKLIVTAMLPSAAFAEYAAASNELPVVTLFPYAVGSVLASRYALLFSAGRREQAAQLWLSGVRKVSLVVVPAALWAFATAPELIALAFGPSYAGAVWPFRIFSLILLARVAQYGTVLQAARDTRTILKLSVFNAGVNLALGIALTPRFGIAGTAMATLVANWTVIALYTRRIARHLELPVRRVMPFGHWFAVSLVATLAALIVTFLRSWLPASPALAMVAETLCFVTVVTVMYRALRLWGKNETRAAWLTLGRAG